jgi:uncharacterized protein
MDTASQILPFVLATGGLVVGVLVGLTGVGGGSLMTPFLVLVMGIAPPLAVGTDLAFAALTKASGLPSLIRNKRLDGRIIGALAAGSVPASIATSAFMKSLLLDPAAQVWIARGLAVSLALTALTLLFKKQISQRASGDSQQARFDIKRVAACLVAGAILGFLVTLTSVGAGALGTACLMLLFPLMPLEKLVGNDLAHAVPLTSVAALGHIWLGTVDWALLVWLLVGSIPGIWLGILASSKIPQAWTKTVLSSLLLLAAAKLV